MAAGCVPLPLGLWRSRLFSHELEDPRHYLVERSAGVDFVVSASAQQWLDSFQQSQRPHDVLRTRSIGIVRPRRQPLHDDRGGCTEQDDVVEPRRELPLIRGTPGQEERVGAGGVQEGLDAVFSPDPVLAATEPGTFVIRNADHFGQPPVVGVDGVVAAGGKFRNHRRFPGS